MKGRERAKEDSETELPGTRLRRESLRSCDIYNFLRSSTWYPIFIGVELTEIAREMCIHFSDGNRERMPHSWC